MSPSYNPLAPVSAAVRTVLNVAALLALAPGGVHQVVPQNTVYPFVLFEVSAPKQLGGLGTWPGHGDMPEIDLRVHAFSEQQNVNECQVILAKVFELFFTTVLTVAGYTVCSDRPMSDPTVVNLGDQVIANVTVHEEVAMLRLVLEQNDLALPATHWIDQGGWIG